MMMMILDTDRSDKTEKNHNNYIHRPIAPISISIHDIQICVFYKILK